MFHEFVHLWAMLLYKFSVLERYCKVAECTKRKKRSVMEVSNAMFCEFVHLWAMLVCISFL